MKVTIEGTQGQVATFIKELCSGGNSAEIMARLAEAGVLSSAEGKDNDAIYEVFDDVSWETRQLAHLILLRGEEDTKGRFLTFDQLKDIPLNETGKMTERSMSSRVGGAKKVCKRLGVKEFVLDIKQIPQGEKRYYLSAGAISTFEQYMSDTDEVYREWLDESGYTYPNAQD